MKAKQHKLMLVAALTSGAITLSACDPNAVSTGGSVYYDSMMWNDYYWYDHHHHERPDRPDRPDKPPRPVKPTPLPAPAPVRPQPVARPQPARPPISRPAGRRR